MQVTSDPFKKSPIFKPWPRVSLGGIVLKENTSLSQEFTKTTEVTIQTAQWCVFHDFCLVFFSI